MMRKPTVTAAVLGLAALGLAAPTTAAQAAVGAVSNCDDTWPPSGTTVAAWDGPNCTGEPLAIPPAGDWGAAGDRASSVVYRSPFVGGLDHVAFYENADISGGHVCLAPGELYAADLTHSRFSSGAVVDNNISAHRWVNRSACAAFLS